MVIIHSTVKRGGKKAKLTYTAKTPFKNKSKIKLFKPTKT